MREYEIRILGEDGRSATVYSDVHLGDASAIAAGRKMALGRKFEVWCGMQCIYPYERLQNASGLKPN